MHISPFESTVADRSNGIIRRQTFFSIFQLSTRDTTYGQLSFYIIFSSHACVLGKFEGLSVRRTMGWPIGIFRRPPFVAMGADRPNWIIRRQAFEENSFFTEDRQTDRNISTPSHPKRAIDRRLSLMSRVGTLAQMLWVKLFHMVSATSHLNWGVEVFLLVCRSSVENFAIIGAVSSFQGQQNG